MNKTEMNADRIATLAIEIKNLRALHPERVVTAFRLDGLLRGAEKSHEKRREDACCTKLDIADKIIGREI
jgi:hypothetical protein